MKLISKSGHRKNKKQTDKGMSKKSLIAICTACFVVAATTILLLVFFQSGADDSHHEPPREVLPAAVQQPDPTPAPTPQPTVEPSPEPTPEPDDNGHHIDFEALLDRNPDVIAWLNIPGTQIDYPVVFSRDNSDYLRRDFDRKNDMAGTLFTDMINRIDFFDRLTVIYGHNMRDGTMFADLHNFADREFFEKNREIKLYTIEGMRIYEIIAAYKRDDNNILYQTDYFDDSVWEAYINEIFSNEDTNANLFLRDIGENDQILTLSTCVRGEDESRFLVQGVLKKGAD